MFTEKKLEDTLKEKKFAVAMSILYGLLALFLIGLGAGLHKASIIVFGVFIFIMGIFMVSAFEDCQRTYDIMVLSNKIEEMKK